MTRTTAYLAAAYLAGREAMAAQYADEPDIPEAVRLYDLEEQICRDVACTEAEWRAAVVWVEEGR